MFQIDQSLNALGRPEYGREGIRCKNPECRIKTVLIDFQKRYHTTHSKDVQVDKIVNGLWNAHNSGELEDHSTAVKEF